MKLRYKGNGKFVSFITNKIYKAKKIFDALGEGYVIFDEGDDWYRYSVDFVENNFEKLSEVKPFRQADFNSLDSSAPILNLA